MTFTQIINKSAFSEREKALLTYVLTLASGAETCCDVKADARKIGVTGEELSLVLNAFEASTAKPEPKATVAGSLMSALKSGCC